jgi:branched-chain amino acid transport system substrate-binding protein
MRRKLWLWAFLVIVAIAVVAILLIRRTEKQTATVTIGHISPLTGDAAIWGNWEKDGIELARNQINAAGGIDGRQLMVIHEDDQGDPSTAVSAFQSLTSARGVRVIIGGSLSSTTLAMAPGANRDKVILLTPSAQSPKLAQAGPFVFRIFASSTIEGAHLAQLAMDSKVSSASILYINNDYGVGLNAVISEKNRGVIKILDAEAYSADARDFRTQIQKTLVQVKPDAIFLLGYPTDMGTILKQMAEMGVHPKVFAPNGFEGEEVLKIAGKAAEGVVYVYPILSSNANASQIKDAFRARYGREMSVYNGMGYDATMVLAEAMRDARSHSNSEYGDALQEALHRVNYSGVTGPISFDPTGGVLGRPMEARIVKDGKFVKLETFR